MDVRNYGILFIFFFHQHTRRHVQVCDLVLYTQEIESFKECAQCRGCLSFISQRAVEFLVRLGAHYFVRTRVHSVHPFQ